MRDQSVPSAIAGRRPIRRRRRVLYFLVMCVLLFVALEASVRVGAHYWNHHLQLGDILERQTDVAVPAVPDQAGVRQEVVHPYVGYVVDPTIRPGFNEFGFLQVDGPVLDRRSDRIIIGVTGGSVARDVCEVSAAALKRRLQELVGPLEVSVVCLAQEGFHQPQQTMAWSYFQCLGAEFDYLVNLDGFNEVALYPAENPYDDVFQAYPRAWEYRLADTNNPELNRLIAQGATLRQERVACARRFMALQKVPLLSVHLLWNALDESLRNQLLDVTARVREIKTTTLEQYAHTGPTRRFKTEPERLEALVDLWSNCSATLNRMCSASGTHYLHRLQPNIGIDAAKVLTAEEQRLAWPQHPYRVSTKAGYPALVERGARLKSEGIDFADLTALYASVPETVYRDDCCHMNKAGNDLIAREIAESIGRHHLEQAGQH